MQTIHRLPENVAGPWFTSDDCIICGLCDEIAPQVFGPDSSNTNNIVHTQPRSKEDLELAEEAMDSCPVEAIHRGEENDG